MFLLSQMLPKNCTLLLQTRNIVLVRIGFVKRIVVVETDGTLWITE